MGNQACYKLATRDNPRVKAQPRALVYFSQGNEMFPYHIVDVSEGGLSFRYLGNKIQRKGTSPVSLYHEYDLIVDNLPAKEVSDIQLHGGLVPERRGSLCFELLSIEQKKKLSRFIEGFTEPFVEAN